jgi:hypothetical protein
MERPELGIWQNASFSFNGPFFHKKKFQMWSIYIPKCAKSNLTKDTFRMKIGIPDFSKKSYLRKNALFMKFKSLKSHNKKNEK